MPGIQNKLTGRGGQWCWRWGSQFPLKGRQDGYSLLHKKRGGGSQRQRFQNAPQIPGATWDNASWLEWGIQMLQLSVSFTALPSLPHFKNCCYIMRKLKYIPVSPSHLGRVKEKENQGKKWSDIEWKTKPNQHTNKSQPSCTFWSFSLMF